MSTLSIASSYQNIIDYLKEHLSEYRFLHCLSVAQKAFQIATILKFSEQDLNTLYIASLLHDVTKEYSVDEHMTILNKYHVDLKLEDVLLSPKTVHSVTGSYVAKELFPLIVTDEVQQAILYHTVGHSDMTVMDKIVFLADIVEERRTDSFCMDIREVFEKNFSAKKNIDENIEGLDKTLIYSTSKTILNLLSKQATISIHTLELYNSLIKKYNI